MKNSNGIFLKLSNILVKIGAGLVLSILIAATAHATAVRPLPVSLGANGQFPNGFYTITTQTGNLVVGYYSTLGDITADGNLVAFTSNAPADSFVPGLSSNSADNVFVRNMRTGETICASCPASTFPVSIIHYGKNPRFSANGRYVVYEGVDASVTNASQIFRYDLQTGATALVSAGITPGSFGNSSSSMPVVNADGRYIAFQSLATNLVSGFPEINTRQLFVRDMQSGQILLASHAAASPTTPGNQPVDELQPVSISANGRYVVWTSKASDLLALTTDTNNATDVFFFDVFSSGVNVGAASLNTTALGTGNGASFGGIVSTNSASFPPTIVFASQASNLNAADPNTNTDIYCYKGELVVRLVSIARDGGAANGAADRYATISRNGRFVAFTSKASNLVAGTDEPNAATNDVFLRDLQTNQTRYVSLNAAGQPSATANGASFPSTINATSNFFLNKNISDDGRFVAFRTDEPLSLRDNAGTPDVYVRDLTAGISVMASLNANGTGGQSSTGTVPTGNLNDTVLTANGRKVLFNTGSVNLFAGDSTTNTHLKIFLANVSLLAQRSHSDFDGDQKNDFAVFRPSEGNWYTLYNGGGGNYSSVLFGESGSRIVPGDYDGDAVTDYGVFSPSFGRWDIWQSSNNQLATKFFGTATDILTPADFDGDGKTDLAYFRPATATWFILQSNTNSLKSVKFGLTGDLPAVGDFDGDNRADVALFRPATGDWWILRSTDGAFYSFHWGIASDKPVTGDYDGDGKSDAAVFRDGSWYILNSRDNTYQIFQWGLSSDRPVVSDYDGDGKTDAAVFRPSDGVWYVRQSSDNNLAAIQWGVNGDQPLPAAFVP